MISNLPRQNFSYLERLRDLVAFSEGEAAKEANVGYEDFADSFYAARQARMDETARAVLANLWCTHRPVVIDATANEVLRQLACESWQIALALEQTRIGYDDAAMQGKRRDAEAAEKAKTDEVHNVD
jgi:hypothetical protein